MEFVYEKSLVIHTQDECVLVYFESLLVYLFSIFVLLVLIVQNFFV